MEEADSQKQRRMFPRSSIQKKPYTNLIPKPHHHYSISSSRSKKRISSTAAVDPYMSDSSTGSTQNRNRVQHRSTVPTNRKSLATPRTPSPDDWVGDGNHMACSRRQTMMKTKSKTKAASVPVYPFHLEKSTNIKENVQIPHVGVNTHEINGKPIVQRNCTPVNNINNDAKVVLKPHSTRKMNGKGNEINVPPRHPSMENTNMDSLVRLKFKDDGNAVVVGSSPVTLSKNYKEKEVVTPISFGALKKAKGCSSEPLMRNRTEAEEAEDALQAKLLTYPLPNKKKRKCSSKGRFKKFVLPQDYIDQQKAYFKEIDEYELDVEEVE